MTDDIRARHHPGAVINRIGPDFGKQQCDYCCRKWPCDAIRMANARDELQATFDLRWNADMRAIAAWREGHPERELTWPDHVDLVLWLSDRADAARADAERLAEALRGCGDIYEVDGKREWHDHDCLHRKTWPMGTEDEPPCAARRAALAAHEERVR